MKIDVVGHFGSRLSYATLTSEICRGLRDAGLLGRVTNLDDSWHEPHVEFRGHEDAGTHCFVVSEPRHYLADAYFQVYGRERVALYSSANTDRVAREHAEVLAKAGRVYVPSQWCATSVQHGWALHHVEADMSGASIEVLPLGVPSSYQWTRKRYDRLVQRLSRRETWTAVHFSTDFVWPGRKGTEELLQAWKRLPKSIPHKLIVHAPRAIYEDIFYRCSDLDLHNTVEIVTPEPRGTEESDLLALFERADTVVLPARAEGFGMMILAALCLGIPTVTTPVTGQTEYLGDFGGWLAAPTGTPGPLAFEEGDAPTVVVSALATALSVAMCPEARRALLLDALGPSGESVVDHRMAWTKWTWSAVRPRWVESIRRWMEAT